MQSSLYPELFLAQTIWRPLVMAIASGILFAAFVSAFAAPGERAAALKVNALHALAFSAPISVLAFVSGYLTGVSRGGVVGNVLPAVLSLIGGIGLYVFGTENRFKIVIGYCVFMFAVNLLYGAQTGALERELGREARVKILSEQERRIRNFRYNLELDEQPPAWIVPRDEK